MWHHAACRPNARCAPGGVVQVGAESPLVEGHRHLLPAAPLPAGKESTRRNITAKRETFGRHNGTP
eukprot:4358780-Lingulodinium_polyedra.AAC.1